MRLGCTCLLTFEQCSWIASCYLATLLAGSADQLSCKHSYFW